MKKELWDKLKNVREKWFKKIQYEPHEGQVKFHNSNAQFRVVCAGTRWGKSLSAGREAECSLLLPDIRVWIVGPTYGLGEKEFRYIHDDMVIKAGLTTKERTYNVKTGSMSLRFPWGSMVEVKSAERPETLLGEEVDLMILSEWSQANDDVFDRYLMGRLISRGGRVIIPTTPAGEGGMVQEYFDMGQDPANRELVESWEAPTTDNPFAPKDMIEMARKKLSKEHFDEQFGGKFVRYTGLVYSEFDVNTHRIPVREIPSSWRRECGLDFGYSDPAVCLFIAFDHDGAGYVYDEIYEPGLLMPELAGRIKRKAGDVPISIFWGDRSAEQERMELASLDIPIAPAENDIKIGVERVRQFLKKDARTQKPRLYVMENCVNTLTEIKKYHYPKRQEGLNSKELPADSFNHAMDALRYCIVGRPDASEIITPNQTNPFLMGNVLRQLSEGKKKHDIIGNELIRN